MKRQNSYLQFPLCRKSEDSFKAILNLKKLNKTMLYICVKMETMKYAFTLVTRNWYMTKLDINQAFYSDPILPEHQKYLKFYFRQKLYQITCLPNGFCSGLRKFTKLLQLPLSNIRLQQVTVAGFANDLITLGKGFVKCETNIKLFVILADSLTFVIHPNKSIFVAARLIECLSFVTDS